MKGNLIELAEQGYFDVIIHGCNCFHTMGAGIALQIKRKYPTAYEADCILTNKGDRSKLGNYTWQRVQSIKTGKEFIIINAYTQFNYGSNTLDYEAVELVFSKIANAFPTERIGYPKIGAGLAGGNWNKIQKTINEKLIGCTHTLVTLN